jgi:ABC-type multidrug transport system fused ATPase/permease subunit
MSNSASTTQQELRRLGEGGGGDRLRFSLVIKVMLRCIPLLGELRRHIIWIVLITLGMALVLIYPGMQLFDIFWTRVLSGETPTAQQCTMFSWFDIACQPWGADARRATLRALIAFTVVFGLVTGTAYYGLGYYRVWILQEVNHLLRVRLLDRLQALSLRFHSETSVGDAIYRMYQDSGMVTELIDVLFLTPIQLLGNLVFAFAMIALYKPGLALAIAMAWPIALYVGYRASRPMRVAFRRAREQNSALTSVIQASLQGIRVIKAYGAEGATQARFEAQSTEAFTQAYEARNLAAVYGVAVFWCFGTLAIIATGWSAWLTTQSTPLFAKKLLLYFGFSVWNLGLWNAFKDRLDDAMGSSVGFFELWGRMQDIAIGLDRVFEVLDLEPEVQDAPDAIAMPKLTRAITYEHVSFAYDGSRPTLDDINLGAKPGTITAIVGPTGSGKSTLMSLLLRLYDPNHGAIRIDGIDLRAIKVASLRHNIAIALQENMLFGMTIRENIRYAVPDASDEQVREAARVAAADEFIELLPDGYDTLLGERGAKLSTGQRQRVSIARAIIKDTPILILDEPTAALDAQTELKVLDNLATWGEGRVIFLITHRLSTIRKADQVAFIANGRLLEIDSHDGLMARDGGSYRRLVEGEEAAANAAPQEIAS